MDFLKTIDGRVPRPRHQFILKCFHTLRWAFGQRFDATVVQVLHKPNYLMTGGGPLRKESKAHTLHVTADEESARYSRHLDSNSI